MASRVPRAGAERRKEARVALAVHVDLASSDNFYAGRARDISLGGLFIDLEGRAGVSSGFAMGSKLTVRLRLFDVEHTIPAEVVWDLANVSGGTVGIGPRIA